MNKRKTTVGRRKIAKEIASNFRISESKAVQIMEMITDIMRRELKNGNIVNFQGVASLRLHPIMQRTWKINDKEYHTKKKYNLGVKMGTFLKKDCMEELPDVR